MTVAGSSVWADAMAQVAAAGDRITTQLHDRGESADSMDAVLALLGAMMDGYLGQICAEPDFPTFVPCCTWFQHTGSPNPDTVYRRAAIDGSGVYRITGERGSARQVTIMPFGEPSSSGMRTWAPFDLSNLASGPDGRVEILLSPERPADHTGDWWPLDPGMASLWLRTVSDDWGNDREPRLAITRLDAPLRRSRSSDETVRRKLRGFAPTAERTIEYGMRHVDELVAEGVINGLKLIDYGASGGMPLQWYHEGVFELHDHECLLLEATVPARCDYFSLSLTDRMLVTLDWVHAQTSLNRNQAVIDDDGVLRVVVAHDDPNVWNWMDTTGYRRGVVQCRWIGSDTPPRVSASTVPLAALSGRLPISTRRVTAHERDTVLAARRIGAQLRTLW